MQDVFPRARRERRQSRSALEQRGITTPFPIQALVLPDALAGLDVLAKAPTGSGKTFAFGLPIVERAEPADGEPSALVLVPTRELAAQVAGELELIGQARGISAWRPSTAARRSRASRRRARGAHILVATPGRLQDLDRAPARLARPRPHARPRRGRPDARHGLQAPGRPARPTAARASARRCSSRRRSTARSASSPAPTRAIRPASRPGRPRIVEQGEVEHTFVSVTADGKLDRLIEELEAERGLALVFVRTKRGADRLAQQAPRARRARPRAARRHVAGPARARARPVPRRQGDDARRHRRRRPRPRPDRHHARDQLRPARGRQGLRPPRRPHRPRRAAAAPGSPSSSPSSRPTSAALPARLGHRRAVRARGDARCPGEARLHEPARPAIRW